VKATRPNKINLSGKTLILHFATLRLVLNNPTPALILHVGGRSLSHSASKVSLNDPESQINSRSETAGR
jgi:hypothetical protein